MRRSIVLATSDFLTLGPLGRRADRAGFDRIWTTETPTRDALVRALVLGLQTERIGWASGIAYAFTRAPLALAATVADIDIALGGRFSVGLGAGTRGMRRTWFGLDDFDQPASRLGEYAALLRAAWAADTSLQFDGTYYRASYHQFAGRRRSVPIWGSGLNPAMLTVAGRHFDGVALHPLTSQRAYLTDVALPAVARGAQGRPRRPQIAVWKITSVDDDPDTAGLRARRSLAMYFSTPSYAPVADHSGWGRVAERVRSAFREHGPVWTALAELIPGSMVEDFCLAGPPAEVAARCRDLETEYAHLGVDELVFQTPLDDDGSAAGEPRRSTAPPSPSSPSSPSSTAINLTAIIDALAPAAVRLPERDGKDHTHDAC